MHHFTRLLELPLPQPVMTILTPGQVPAWRATVTQGLPNELLGLTFLQH